MTPQDLMNMGIRKGSIVKGKHSGTVVRLISDPYNGFYRDIICDVITLEPIETLDVGDIIRGYYLYDDGEITVDVIDKQITPIQYIKSHSFIAT